MTVAILTPVHEPLLPGVSAVQVRPQGHEDRRDSVYQDGRYLGDVVFVIQLDHEDETGAVGWRPAWLPTGKLASRVEAIQAVLR